MDFVVVIPARYQSERLPGKPLIDIHGKTMIQRVYEQASASQAKKVIVATDDQKIFSHVESFGGCVCMTDEGHASGTDRIHEVGLIEKFSPDQIVVNVQGDEPLIPPAVINQVAENVQKFHVPMTTLGEVITDIEDVFDPNIVKVVCDEKNHAIYFSRAPIPWVRGNYDTGKPELNTRDGNSEYKPLRHLGLYAYRYRLLKDYVKWEQAPLEKVEKLEQLRVLWKGEKIHIEESVELFPPGIDTEADLDRTRQYLQGKAESQKKPLINRH